MKLSSNESINNDNFSVNLEMNFTFSREHFNVLFTEKQLAAGKEVRDLTDEECEDLILQLYDYIEDQLYDLYSVGLEQEGYVNEYINEYLPDIC